MSRFLRDLALLVLSVLAAIAVLLILVNPGAKPGLAVSSESLPTSTTVVSPPTSSPSDSGQDEVHDVVAVLSVSNRRALCAGGEARFTVTLKGPGALDPGRAAIEIGGVAGETEIALEAGDVVADPPSAAWSAVHEFEADPNRRGVSLRVVRVEGPPVAPVELNEICPTG